MYFTSGKGGGGVLGYFLEGYVLPGLQIGNPKREFH